MRLALAVLLLVPAAVQAQRARPFAEKGDLALVAAVSGLTTLQPAAGGVGLRYRLTDRAVLGTSIGISSESSTRESETGDRDQDVTRQNVRLSLWNENHLGTRRRLVSPFLGVGATFGVGRERYEAAGQTCDSSGCVPGGTDRQSASTLSFGAGALLGAEVRLARGITVGAAYTLGVTVEQSSHEESRASDGGAPREDDRTSVRAGTGLTDLHLSVYF